MRYWTGVASSLLVVLLIAAAAAAMVARWPSGQVPLPEGSSESKRGVVEGSVVDEAGRPVAFADVALEPTREGRRARTALTDENGVFRFLAVSPGRYAVRPFVEGYPPRQPAIETLVTPGSKISLTVALIGGRALETHAVARSKIDDILGMTGAGPSDGLELGIVPDVGSDQEWTSGLEATSARRPIASPSTGCVIVTVADRAPIRLD